MSVNSKVASTLVHAPRPRPVDELLDLVEPPVGIAREPLVLLSDEVGRAHDDVRGHDLTRG